jgi:hypothetical protein
MRFLHSPVFYLVGSNLVFWGLPLLLIQLKSQTVVEEPTPAPRVAELVSAPPPAPDPLSELPPLVVDPDPQKPVVTESVVREPLVVPPPVPAVPVVAQSALPAERPVNLMKQLRGAAGLGGPITLKNLKEPVMPIAARVERLQQKSSGDSLAALPRHWRESLRQELPAAKPVSEAAVVRLPVPALKQRQEVPVIVNERGEGEALVAPEDQRVRQAVESWAARQVAASPGTVQVYVVAAEPLATD